MASTEYCPPPRARMKSTRRSATGTGIRRRRVDAPAGVEVRLHDDDELDHQQQRERRGSGSPSDDADGADDLQEDGDTRRRIAPARCRAGSWCRPRPPRARPSASASRARPASPPPSRAAADSSTARLRIDSGSAPESSAAGRLPPRTLPCRASPSPTLGGWWRSAITARGPAPLQPSACQDREADVERA